ncbi:hypothetical protein B0T17DRAFT_632243 [Bombardia bombarda]|uniref:Uncharacterized protein n=1 Tax=Bombardia bombarda TaxID=252184 RepID=A0AA39X7Z4_9PEZI|nr:hypothetical protein B0T17DRAFT_632243 [Bombardia bombarda]
MLRRRSVKSKSDLKRRKSTSSTHGVHLEHIDPTLAQRDAQIAACQAYARAQDRAKAEMPLFPLTPDSSPRRRQANSSSLTHDRNETPRRRRENSQDLHRRQSVRFMGPCSIQGRTPRGRGTNSNSNDRDTSPGHTRVHEDYDTISLHDYTLGSSDGHSLAQQPRHPYRAPPPIPLPGLAADYLSSLVSGDEHYTPEDDLASAPSSYRRLRTSRSMVTSDECGNRKSFEGYLPFLNERLPASPNVNTRRLLHSDPDSKPSPRSALPLRAPRSMSFLRHRNNRSRSITSRDDNDRGRYLPDDTGIQEEMSYAHEQGIPQTPQHKLKAPSFFRSRSRQPETGIRKSLRSSNSADGLGVPTNSDTVPPAPPLKEDGFKIKARKASKTLKTKLKTLFNLTKSEEGAPSLPVQHIDSQRTHVTDCFESLLSLDEDHGNAIDWSSIHEVPSKVPSLRNVPANLLHSNRGSLESLRSERERKVSDDKSLTSWVHSGPSTLTSQQQRQWQEWERQRLSIIRESGTHAPSPSIRRQALVENLFQHRESVAGIPPPSGPIVDSQRIYSALMKRANEANKQSSENIDEQQSKHWNPLRVMASSDSLNKFPRQTSRGIRYTASDPDLCDTPTRGPKGGCLPGSRGLECKRSHTTFPTTQASRDKFDPSTKRDGRVFFTETGTSRSTSTTISTDLKSGPDPFVRADNDLSRSDPSVPPCARDSKTMLDGGRAFFAGPASHLFRTTSPYRRALRKTMEDEQAPGREQGQTFGSQNSEASTKIHADNSANRELRANSGSTNKNGDSESVYSTDDDGGAARAAMNVNRDSTIIADSPRAYRPSGYRMNSSASSTDWQSWLAANIAKLEPSPSPPKPCEVEYALPTMPRSFPSGHVRETAQTHEEYDEESLVFEPPTRKPTLPTSPLSMVEPNVVKVSPQQRSIKRSTPPSVGRLLYENDSPLGPPTIPIKSALRETPLL